MKVRYILREVKKAGYVYLNVELGKARITTKVPKRQLLTILRQIKDLDLPARRDALGRLFIG